MKDHIDHATELEARCAKTLALPALWLDLVWRRLDVDALDLDLVE
jgi:hypothetical protein